MFGWRKRKGGGKVRGKYLEESIGFMIFNCVFEIVTDIFPCVGTFPYLRPRIVLDLRVGREGRIKYAL